LIAVATPVAPGIAVSGSVAIVAATAVAAIGGLRAGPFIPIAAIAGAAVIGRASWGWPVFTTVR
jgi:hypothetical protein